MMKTFGDFRFDDRRRALTWRGQRRELTAQATDVLSLLVERPGELVTREEIRVRLWPDSNVEFDHSLDVVVSRLRSILGDSGKSPRYIETVPKKGYRFIEPVNAHCDATRPDEPRRWIHRAVTYAVVAMLAALAGIVFAHTRY